jgi:nucleoside-diphosphate-sugar epimerase
MIDSNFRLITIGRGQIGKSIHQLAGENATLLSVRDLVQESDLQIFKRLRSATHVCWTGHDAPYPNSKFQNNALIGSTLLARLLNSLGELPGLHFTYISTGGAIYGNAKIIPTPEIEPLRPISLYGQTKMMHENQIRKIFEDRNFLILRPSNVFSLERSAEGIVNKLLAKNPDLKFYGIDSIRDYIELNKMCGAIVKMALEDAGGTYNLGSSIGTSLKDLAALLSYNVSQSQIYGMRSEDVNISVLDGGEALRKFDVELPDIEFILKSKGIIS